MAAGIGTLALAVFGGWFVLFVSVGLMREASQRLPRVGNPALELALEADFRQLDFTRGASQLTSLSEAYQSLTEVIHLRLNVGELAFDRYMKAAESVYQASMQNLQEAVIALRSVSAIDPDHVEGRLTEIAATTPRSDASPTEAALASRIALRGRQLHRVEDLMAMNEESLTALGTTASALADTRTGAREMPLDARAAIDHLESLARRTNQYAAAGSRDASGRQPE
ncbi:MAG: hypothetical protein WC273_01810 [Dehalococcoidia bacterium]